MKDLALTAFIMTLVTFLLFAVRAAYHQDMSRERLAAMLKGCGYVEHIGANKAWESYRRGDVSVHYPLYVSNMVDSRNIVLFDCGLPSIWRD